MVRKIVFYASIYVQAKWKFILSLSELNVKDGWTILSGRNMQFYSVCKSTLFLIFLLCVPCARESRPKLAQKDADI